MSTVLTSCSVDSDSDVWENATFKALVLNSTDYIFVLDKSGFYRFVSPSFKKEFGPKQEIIGRHYSYYTHPRDKAKAKLLVFSHIRIPYSADEQTIEYRMIGYRGNVLCVQTKSINLTGNPTINGFVCYARDITTKKETQEKLEYIAYNDTLTHLPNRQSFIKKLEQTARSCLDNDHDFAVLFIDLDRFKSVNDTFGHNIGDKVLQQCADRLAKTVCLFGAYAARLGGDEFTIIIESNLTLNLLENLCKKIIRVVGADFLVDDNVIQIGCSIGVNYIEKSQHQDPFDEFLRNADKAMYLAKQRGRGQYVVYNREPSLNNKAYYKSDYAIKEALNKNEIYTIYETIASLNNNESIRYESFLAWKQVNGQVLSQFDFLTEETEANLVNLLTQFLIEENIKLLARVKEKYNITPKISINITSKKINLQHIYQTIDMLTVLNHIDPSQLILEIKAIHFDQINELAANTEPGLPRLITYYIDSFNDQTYNIFELLRSRYTGVKLNWIKLNQDYKNSEKILKNFVRIFSGSNKEVFMYNVDSDQALRIAKATGISCVQGPTVSKIMSTVELLNHLEKKAALPIF